jgi:molybdopterin converting factor small subunit
MVKVEVRLFATLRQYTPSLGLGEALELEFPGGTTLADLLVELQVPADEVKRFFVNYRSVAADYVLQDGDRVSIFPLVAGG